ncbi:hypothetical protein [Desertivirga arenae]|uniref:hypothetical protein n=1 Tax=Desertivirga arenae TaxID=2810309 RepID=UPI001A95C32F|nr:hypothetical protein [Pedobacter sp. SYSU D00823]
MPRPSHYLSIKPIFDIAVFGFPEVESYLKKNGKVKFCYIFVLYQNLSGTYDNVTLNENLIATCSFYFSVSEKKDRKDLVRVIQDHPESVQAMISSMLVKDRFLDEERAYKMLNQGFEDFINFNISNDYVLNFFNHYFSNLQQINPQSYENMELDLKQYMSLISEYL